MYSKEKVELQRKEKTNLPPAGSLLEQLQQPDLSQLVVRSLEFHVGLPHGWQRTQQLGSFSAVSLGHY